MKPITLGIAEDHLLIRQGLVTMLNNEDRIHVLFDVSNGKELLDQLEIFHPQILILDLQMPVMGGAEAYAVIKEKYPNIKVIILSMHYNDAYIKQFAMNGVVGFLPKNCDFEKMLDTIYSVYEQGYYFDSVLTEFSYKNFSITTTSSSDNLSEREIDIIRLLYNEKNVEEIAGILFIDENTVEWHKSEIFGKTETKTVIGLLKYAISRGIINLT